MGEESGSTEIEAGVLFSSKSMHLHAHMLPCARGQLISGDTDGSGMTVRKV